MKRTITLVAAMSGVLFFTSCKREESSNIDQNRIYSNYEFVYDAGTNVSSVTATFRLDNSGGQKLELSYPSRVDFNGERLSWRQAMGNYKLTRSGFVSNGKFNFFDVADKHYSNDIAALSSIDIPFGMNSISKSGNFFLPWTGGPLMSGESVIVRISGAESGGTKVFMITQPGATHIVLEQYKLNALGVGTANIQIERRTSGFLTSSNLSGGRIESVYKGRKISINIVN